MDNLNTNDAMMKKIEDLLEDREIPFKAEDSRIMCFPHTINIAVQHVLARMTAPINSDDGLESSSADDSTADNSDHVDQRGRAQTFEQACKADPIGRCRRLVVKLRSSGQRRDDFINWVKTGNEQNFFKIKGQAVKLPHKELLRDVQTRWDSTYQMIRRCIEMRPVCIYLFILWFLILLLSPGY